MTEVNPFLEFTDAHLKAAFQRALRSILILTLLLAPIFWLASGWQTSALLAVGAVISSGSLFEWERLIAIINAKMDKQKTPRSTVFVVGMFFLRLVIAAGLLYGSLKCFHGSIYGLIAGLGLAVVALSIEAVRLLRT